MKSSTKKFNNGKKEYTCAETGLQTIELEDFTEVKINDNYTFNIKKIGTSILYIQCAGSMAFSDIKGYYELLNEFAKKVNIKKPWVEIRDLTNLTGRAPRTEIIKQKEYYQNAENNIAGFVLCNPPLWMRAIMLAGTRIYRTSIIFDSASNYKEAISKGQKIISSNSYSDKNLSNTNIAQTNNSHQYSINKKHIDEFITLMGTIPYIDHELKVIDEILSADNPLSIFKDILKTTKEDIFAMRKRDQQLTQDYFNIFEAIQAGIIIVNIKSKKIVFANSTAGRMTNTTSKKMLDQICHKFICHSDQGKCPIIDLKMSIDNSERTMLTTDGESIPVLKSVKPFTYHGEPCLLETFIDISKQKKAEEKLLKTNVRRIQLPSAYLGHKK